jgi:hypothetical protein
MASPDWLELAIGVLPPLPHDVTCIRNDGGQVRLTLLEQRDGHLYCQISMLEAREGLQLTIPIENGDRGGYSIGCEIRTVYFMGGLHSAAQLDVTEVRRRKPYRAKERIEATAIATLHVIASQHHQLATPLLGRVIDLSSSGIGFTTESQLTVGDRLRIDTHIAGVTLHAEITVVQTGRIAFGRWRAGCQFTQIPLHTQHQLDQLTTTTTQNAA